MTHTPDSALIVHVTEALSTHEPDSVAKALAIVLNAAIRVERHQVLQAFPYEHTESRQGYANRYKDKTISSQVGKITLKVPQVRGDLGS